MSSENLVYRKNVAAIIVNDQKQILIAARTDFPDSWQFPQGGIDEGETAEEALFRELGEEIGTSDITVLAKLPFPIRYQWPPELHKRGYQGQEQTYFLVRLQDANKLDLNKMTKPEFYQIKWVDSEAFLDELTGFKKEAYKQAIQYFLQHYPNLIG